MNVPRPSPISQVVTESSSSPEKLSTLELIYPVAHLNRVKIGEEYSRVVVTSNRPAVQPPNMASCEPWNDNAFGPIVKGCRSDFDFTLLFEQSVFTIGPAALLLLFTPPRLVKLSGAHAKTLPTPVRSVKAVSSTVGCR